MNRENTQTRGRDQAEQSMNGTIGNGRRGSAEPERVQVEVLWREAVGLVGQCHARESIDDLIDVAPELDPDVKQRERGGRPPLPA